ncbi:MAG: hypothetical protein ACMUHY_05705 [Thermoplasmatota archaeon]
MEKKAEKISFVFLIIGILLVLTAIPFIFIYDILGDPFTVEDPRANEHHEFMVMNGTSNFTVDDLEGEIYICVVNGSFPERVVVVAGNETIYDSRGKQYSNTTDVYNGERFTYRGWFELDGPTTIDIRVNGTCHIMLIEGMFRDYKWPWERWHWILIFIAMGFCVVGLGFMVYDRREFSRWRRRNRREKWRRLRSRPWTRKQRIGLALLAAAPLVGVPLLVIQLIYIGKIFELATVSVIVVPSVIGWSFIWAPTESETDESVLYYHCINCGLINEIQNRERPYTHRCTRCGHPLFVPENWEDLAKGDVRYSVFICLVCRRTVVVHFISRLEFRCPNCTTELIMDRKYPGKNPVMRMKGLEMTEK